MKFKHPIDMETPLSIIEGHVDDCIRNNDNINCGLISSQLTNMTKDMTKFNINVVTVDSSQKPFIMCIYPSVEELDKLATPLVDMLNKNGSESFCNLWGSIKTWEIEIDSRLVTNGNRLCVDNGGQFVAILMHELGHIKHTHPVSLSVNYKMNKAKMDILTKLVMNKPSVAKLFIPMMTCISGLRVVISTPGRYMKEIYADGNIPKQYRPFLVDYIDDHIMTNPETAHGIVVTDEEFDTEQLNGVEFTAQAVRMMKVRRSVVKVIIDSQHKLQSSPYFKKLAKTVSRDISTTAVGESVTITSLSRDRVLVERFMRDYKDAEKQATYLLEGGIKVDNREIALLQVQIDNMITPDDKNYVLNSIFDLLDALEVQKEAAINKVMKNNSSKNLDALATVSKPYDEKIQKLNNMLKEVSATKVQAYGKHYGVFIEYPEGYEG